MEQEQIYSKHSLFVGDLAQFCSEPELKELFTTYGEVSEVRIMRNSTTKKPLCYGFVTFITTEGATAALNALNNTPFHGRNLRIGWAAHNFQVQKKEESVVNSLYIRFSTPQVEILVTEETLHTVFDQYNNVTDASIKKTVCDKELNIQSGYGFIHFSSDHAGIASAFHALAEVHNTTINNVTYNVEASKNLLKQFKDTTTATTTTAATTTSNIKATTTNIKSLSKPVRNRTQTNSFDSGIVSSSPISYIGVNDMHPSGSFTLKKPTSCHSRTPSNESLLSNGSGSGNSNGKYSPYTQHPQRGLGNTYTSTIPASLTRSGGGGSHIQAVYPGNPHSSGSYPPRSGSIAAGGSGTYNSYTQPRGLPVGARSVGYSPPSTGSSSIQQHMHIPSMGNTSNTQSRTIQSPYLYNTVPPRSYAQMNTGKEGMLYARPPDPPQPHRGVTAHQRSPQQPSPLYHHQQLQHQSQQHQQIQQQLYPYSQVQQQQYQQHSYQSQHPPIHPYMQPQQRMQEQQPYRQSTHSIPSSQRSAHSIPSSSRTAIQSSILPPPPLRYPSTQQNYSSSENNTYNSTSIISEGLYPSAVRSQMTAEDERRVLIRETETVFTGAHQRAPSGNLSLDALSLDNYSVNNKNTIQQRSVEASIHSRVGLYSRESGSGQHQSSIDSNCTDLDEMYGTRSQETRSIDEYNHSTKSLTAFLRSSNRDIGMISPDSWPIDQSHSQDLNQFSDHAVRLLQSDSTSSSYYTQPPHHSTEQTIRVVDLQDLHHSAWKNNTSTSASEYIPTNSLSIYGTTDSGLYTNNGSSTHTGSSSTHTGSCSSSISSTLGRSVPSLTSMTGTKTIGSPLVSTYATFNPTSSSSYNPVLASSPQDIATSSHQHQSQQQSQQDNMYLVTPPLKPTTCLQYTAINSSSKDYSPDPSFDLTTTISNLSLKSTTNTFHNNNYNNTTHNNFHSNTTDNSNHNHNNNYPDSPVPVVAPMSTHVSSDPTKLN